jgi:UDP-N-acetylmuramoyl-tripeptide--D-alanyl-D-alanine ligase
VRDWSPEQVAAAAGARLVAAPQPQPQTHPPAQPTGPLRAEIDSRAAGPGDLFVGLMGGNVDGGQFATGALTAGAWGVLVSEHHARGVAADGVPGVVLAAEDPLAAMQRLATAWRRALACPVIGVTGSVGKTTTKDVLAAMLASAHVALVANEKNLNTEIGLPLTILRAPAGTEALILEMGMRGAGQIAELAQIAEPDVGIITALGPVHLEQLGTMEAIAAEKASLLAALPAGRGVAVVPADEPLLDIHRRSDLKTVTFGPEIGRTAADVAPADLAGLGLDDRPLHVRIDACAALAAARAIGAEPVGPIALTLSEMRGQRLQLPGGITVVDDCYNANPLSMRAALDDLAATAPGRRVAVLGDMRELGPAERAHHEEVGVYARAAGVELLIAVGPLSAGYAGDHAVPDAAAAAALVPGLLAPGDTVLIKASRGVGLEAVTGALRRAEAAKLPTT